MCSAHDLSATTWSVGGKPIPESKLSASPLEGRAESNDVRAWQSAERKAVSAADSLQRRIRQSEKVGLREVEEVAELRARADAFRLDTGVHDGGAIVPLSR
jgi:hypothetical protein